jgi:hypothetical protein
MKRAVEVDGSGVVAGAWAVGKAAHEDVREQQLGHDAERIVVVSADPACIVDMICSGVEQDCVSWEAVDSHTNSTGIAGGKATSSDPFEDDSKAGIPDAASSAPAWAHMFHRAFAEVMAAWAFVAHTSCWDSC